MSCSVTLEPSVITAIVNDYSQLGTEVPGLEPDPNPEVAQECGTDASIWNSEGIATINMGVTLLQSTPDYQCGGDPYQEPNANAASTTYKFPQYLGWKVTVGTTLVVVYVVREAHNIYFLRRGGGEGQVEPQPGSAGASTIPETECFRNPPASPKQVRRPADTSKNIKGKTFPIP